ncbi:MAG: ABC-type nitrate/sulfonate/bicarbonate transport system, ATPase component [Myxococcales bacterium]|nr:ABC-type nitrate/sulfonate/bicarbonate transport system, ATPase component [Myxococcales bacterium]
MIALDNVSKHFTSKRGTHHVLSDVSLTIDEGQFVCLLGPSGCGKSTLLNLIAGLDTPDQGTLAIDGKPIAGPGPDRSVMFQDSALFPWLSVRRNVDFGLELAGFRDKDERASRVETFLKKVQLWRFRDAYVHELSGGMKQRVALARALAPDPRVLLMDEPFAALDAQTRDVLHVELTEIWRATRKTVVFVTHNVREAVRLGDRVVLMATRPGRVKLDEPIALARPRTNEGDVAHYVGRIMKELRTEVEKVMREEIDDAWQPAPGAVPGSSSSGVGGGI